MENTTKLIHSIVFIDFKHLFSKSFILLGLPRPFLSQGAFLGLAKFRDPNDAVENINDNDSDRDREQLDKDKEKLR